MFGLFGEDTKKLRQERNEEAQNALMWQMKHIALQTKWNELVTRINGLGGEEFLQNARLTGLETPSQFSEAELRSLLQLVHPDKHGGKESAVTLTQKINALRSK